jgi:hypothetical protein
VTLTDNRARIFGSTGAATSNYQLGCASAVNMPDVVYYVDVPAGSSRLVARVAEASFDSIVGIRRAGAACEVQPDLACNDDEDFPDVVLSSAFVRAPAAGRYAIIVDAYAGEGAFTLELELVP